MSHDSHETTPSTPPVAEDIAPVDTGQQDDDTHLVPVTEAIRYRKRAQAAEQQLAALQEQLETHRSELNDATQTIDRLERRQRIDALLSDSDAVDLSVARLLTEQAVAEMDEPDVALAIQDLRRHKPYLFRQRGHGSPAMAARPYDPTPDPTEQAAERAIHTGSRRDLLDYLKLRRRSTSAQT